MMHPPGCGGHVDLRFTRLRPLGNAEAGKLKVSGLRRCWDRRKIVTMNGLYDTGQEKLRHMCMLIHSLRKSLHIYTNYDKLSFEP